MTPEAEAGGSGQPDAGASGQQPTGTTQPAAAAATTTVTQPAAGASNGQPPTGAQSGTVQFDPKDYIPRHRFNEVSGQAKLQKEQIEDLNRRLTLALGGQPQDPNQQKSEQVKNAFFQMFPQFKRLAELPEDQFEALISAPQSMSRSAQAEQAQWQRHGEAQIDAAASKVADAIGTETLDADQRDDLRVSMKDWLEKRVSAELAQAADRYGKEVVQANERRFSASLQRYEKGDPKLLDEFVTRYTKNWVEPARRAATARTSTRTRAVPETGNRNAVTSIQRPSSFKNWDERLEYAAKLARERGATFSE